MEDAIEWALSGRCIVYPTSTLPALGCIPASAGLDELYSIKRRSNSSPVSLGVADLNQAREIVQVPEDVPEILEFFPEGSLTIVLRPNEEMDERLGGNEVAVRVVSHPTARSLLLRTGPLTATSANLSGLEPLLSCVEAADSLSSSRSPVLAIEGVCEGGSPSTLIAWHTVCNTPESFGIEVIREGKVSTEDIISWWKKRT
ncbi:MAG: hypothetical protein CMA88_05110 [Euryarchaeota archaeon]|nr:hypothetical protein [Euryarchaeota archaeon]